MRAILCPPCGTRYEPAGRRVLYPATAIEPAEWIRVVIGTARQPTQAQRTIYMNDVPIEQDTDEYSCDQCGAGIRPGTPAICATAWVEGRPEPAGWEVEYLEAPAGRPAGGAP